MHARTRRGGHQPMHLVTTVRTTITLYALGHVDINAQNIGGDTPLMQALGAGSRDAIAVVLLELHADPNICNREELSPLMVAVLHSSVRITELLLRNGANISYRQRCSSGPDLTMLTQVMHRGLSQKCLAQMRLLLLWGADPSEVVERKTVRQRVLELAVPKFSPAEMDMLKAMLGDTSTDSVTESSTNATRCDVSLMNV